MRNRTYLNTILTVNAVLLAGLTWTQISETAIFAQSAHAQRRTLPPGRSTPYGQVVPNIPNAAAQRDAIKKAVVDLRGSVEKLQRSLESGRLRVEVTNLDDITVNID